MSPRAMTMTIGTIASLLATRGDSVRTVVGRWPNGAIAYERHYVGSREEGTAIGRWEDGSIRFAYHYEHGEMVGVARDWYRGGQLYRETNYVRGHEDGRQRMWWPDGSLRATYVVRDGRRYGLLGSKGCVARDSTADVE